MKHGPKLTHILLIDEHDARVRARTEFRRKWFCAIGLHDYYRAKDGNNDVHSWCDPDNNIVAIYECSRCHKLKVFGGCGID